MDKVKVYFAPMEGVSIYCYRNVHRKLFPKGLDGYYTPFLAVHKHHAFKKRDVREIKPENNIGTENMLIPQIMAGSADEIIWAVGELKSKGFNEANINAGCPVSTVVSKNKGSGLLKDVKKLDEIFEEVFLSSTLKDFNLSIKTRLGLESSEEFKDILPIYNKYPFSKIIIHPRVRTQMYKGKPDMDMFTWAYENCNKEICYNGDITTVEDYARICAAFPNLKEVMIGRGLVQNPALAREIATGEKLSISEVKLFVSELSKAYREEIPGEEQIMHKMKEMWFYLGGMFKCSDGADAEQFIHKIRVAKNLSEYRNAERELYRNCVIK